MLSIGMLCTNAQTVKFMTTSEKTLEKVTSVNGIGYRLTGANPIYWKSNGLGSTDFSIEYTGGIGNTTLFPHLQTYYTNGGFGATGRYAFAGGGGNVASGNQATVFGLGNVVTGASSFAMGQGNLSSGSRSVTFNGDNQATGGFTFVTGSQNIASGNQAGVYSGNTNTSKGINGVIVGGYGNKIETAGASSIIGGSVNSEAYGIANALLGSAQSKIYNNGNSIISTGSGINKGSQSSIIASQSSVIDDPQLWYSAILASNRSYITKEITSDGSMNQAIIASDSSIIYSGNPGSAGTNIKKWNNAIIASEQSDILAGVSYNLTTGKFTQGNSSAQLVTGILNEEFPHVGVTDPNKRTFVVGGGAQDQNIYSYKNPTTKEEWPRSYWNRRDVFYVQHNGKVFAYGDMNASQYKLNDLNTAPTSATDTGTKGEIRVTTTHIYVCIATNTWVRTPLTTW